MKEIFEHVNLNEVHGIMYATAAWNIDFKPVNFYLFCKFISLGVFTVEMKFSAASN